MEHSWPSKKGIPRSIVGSAACVTFFAVLVASRTFAQAPDEADVALDEGDPRVHAALILDAATLRAGDTFRAGVLFRMDPGWHIYYRNPGDGALATEVVLSGDGLRFDPLQWPAPSRFAQQNDFIVNFGYAEETLLFATGHVSSTASSNTARIRAELDFLVCKVDCIPVRLMLERDITLGVRREPAAPETVTRFDTYAGMVPVPAAQRDLRIETVLSQSAVRPGDSFRAAVGIVSCHGPSDAQCPRYRVVRDDAREAFIPERVDNVSITPVAVRDHPSAYAGIVIELEGKATPDDPGRDQTLSGVVHLIGPEGEPVYIVVQGKLPRAREGARVTPTRSALLGATTSSPARVESHRPSLPPIPFVQALWLALLGGLLLNFMPCVFPVLAIKASGLTRLARAEGATVAAHAWSYAVGVLGTMLALALIVVLLRASGIELGWGFHLQSPWFVALLASVLVVLSLSLFGVFSLGVSTNTLAERVDQTHGLWRSVGEGVLAVVVATPCTAPFLGAAVGLAFASSVPVVFGIFAAIGVGLAAPVIVLALAPSLARFLPKPGPFLIHVERVFGFILLGTVVWLLWLLGRSSGVDGMTRVMAFLLLVACATYLVATIRPAKLVPRVAMRLLLVGIVVGSATFALRLDHTSAARPAHATDHWKSWDPVAVDAALDEGRVVFIDFTADWCVTCKVNESLVLEDARVRDAFRSGNVAAFKADWTRRDDRIGAELARHGRAGVPMYLVINPRESQRPEVLPELLTVDIVLQALGRAGVVETT